MGIIGALTGKRGLGYKRDKVDSRDLMLSALQLPEVVPTSASVLQKTIAIKNQGSTGSCVGQSVSNAIRLAYLVGNDEQCANLSALFVYYNSRKEETTLISDTGTYIRDAIKSVQKFGVCPESKWAFSTLRVNRMPDWNAYRTAHDRRGLRGYYRIASGDLDGVRRAIAHNRPVVAGWDVNQSFMDYSGVGSIGAQSAPYLGGHAMIIAAYTPSDWTIVNSWGLKWGNLGTASVTDGFIRQAMDLWAIDV